VLKRILVLMAAASLAGLGATGGRAGASAAFLCYSKWQIDPGVWTFKTTPRGNSARALFATGYWSPYAEKSIPTDTRLPGGWYLLCNLGQPAVGPTGLQVESGNFVDNGGTVWTPASPLYRAVFAGAAGKAGYYPMAQ
jgi:hypothetical protein